MAHFLLVRAGVRIRRETDPSIIPYPHLPERLNSLLSTVAGDRIARLAAAGSISLRSIGLKLLAVCFGLELAVSAVLTLRQSIEMFIWHNNGCIEGTI